MRGWREEFSCVSTEPASIPRPSAFGPPGDRIQLYAPPSPAPAFTSHSSTGGVQGSELTSFHVFNTPGCVAGLQTFLWGALRGGANKMKHGVNAFPEIENPVNWSFVLVM